MNRYYQQAKTYIQPEFKKFILPAVFFILMCASLGELFGFPFILLFGLFFLCIKQGLIEIAKYMIEGRSEEIEVSNQGVEGIKHYFRYFSTYFLYDLFELIGIFLIFFVVFVIYAFKNVDVFLTMSSDLNLAIEDPMVMIQTVLVPAIIAVVISIIFLAYYHLTYQASFYLLNDDCKGMKALKLSRQYMKHHKMDLFQLYLSYLPKMLLVIALALPSALYAYSYEGALSGALGVVDSIIFTLVMSYLIYPYINISKYLYFKEWMPVSILEKEEVIVYDELPIEREIREEKKDDSFGFEPIGKKKLILGTLLFVPFYLWIGQYVFSVIFLMIPFFRNITDTYSLNAWFNFFYDGSLLLIGMIIFREFFKDFFKRFFRSLQTNIIWFTLKGYFIVYATSILSSAVVALLLPNSSDTLNQSTIEEILSIEPVPMLISVIIFAPILEELIFRGVIFRTIRMYNKPLAHIVSAFAFGFIHVAEAVLVLHQYTELIQMITYIVMGLVFSLIYEKHKSIGCNIYLHMLNNLSSCIIILLL